MKFWIAKYELINLKKHGELKDCGGLGIHFWNDADLKDERTPNMVHVEVTIKEIKKKGERK